ncbi:MAG: L-serine dehydratase, partial [Planktomarina sp.]
MFLSVFDMFKIGIGPSSSHTMGPMVASGMFLDLLRASPFEPAGVQARLHGSLAFTGVGHATDRATLLGLAGFQPSTFDAAKGEAALEAMKQEKVVHPAGLPSLRLDPASDILFDYGPALPGHANGMVFMATDAQGDVILQQSYYSIGGGFVVTEEDMASGTTTGDIAPYPYEFNSANELLDLCAKQGKSIAEVKRENELSRRNATELEKGLAEIWAVMNACINRGLERDGILPGGLNVKRRAKGIYDALLAERGLNMSAPHTINDWMSVYAMAVNEENAAGGQVVTAPTNGAAGVVPATIRYWLDHVPGASPRQIPIFLLTAAAIGGLIKFNASISGAECGCQAEVGSAAAMAAAGLCAVLGGTALQV